MDVPVVLVADSSPEFRQALADALGQRYCVHCCGTGTEALALLDQLRPEAMVLDLMLPEMDGLSLIQAAGPGRVPPVVLLTSPYYNGYILEAVEALHISFAMRRPCGIESVVMRLDDLCSRRGRQAGLAFVEDHLRSLEFNQPLLGSRMLPLTVVLFARDPDQSITKEVYPEVARQWGQGAAWRKVEKDIRYAIDTAWANGNKEAWAQHLRLDHKPSNKEFIARMAELLNAWRTE